MTAERIGRDGGKLLGFFLVFIGSGIGGLLRHGAGLVFLRFLGPSFPYGTLMINVLGSALMGLIIGLFASIKLNYPDARLFLTTGVIGGFTTFSTFSLDAVTLWERGEILAAFGYVLASVALSLAALMGVLLIVRRFA